MANEIKSSEVDKNFTAFQKLLPELLNTHPGKFVLMHDGKAQDFFDTLGDAARIGKDKFGDKFSVQEVTNRDVNLGCYTSYALHTVPHQSI